MIARLRRSIALEDVALYALLVLVPLLGAGGSAGAGGPGPSGGAGDGRDPLLGLIYLVAALGAIVAVATRVPGRAPIDTRGDGVTDAARFAAIGPFVGGVALVSGEGARLLGFGAAELLLPVALVATVAGYVLGDRLPVVPAGVRRGLMTPFVLVCASIFDGFVASTTRGLDPVALAGEIGAQAGLVAFAVAMLVLGTAVFYAMLIYAPRELAEGGTPGRVWLVRFALFLVATVAGLVVASALS